MSNELIALLDFTCFAKMINSIPRLYLPSLVLNVSHLAFASPGRHHDTLVHHHSVDVADVVSMMAARLFFLINSCTAKSRTMLQVELMVLSKLGSLGKFAVNSSTLVPIYWAMESPQGSEGLNGTCLAFCLIADIDLILDLSLFKDFIEDFVDDLVNDFAVDEDDF